MRLENFLPFILVLVLLPLGANALTVIDRDRRVNVTSFVDASGRFTDTSAEGESSFLAGSFLEAAVGGTGFGDITNASGEASQNSAISIPSADRLLVEGGGSSGVVFDVNDAGFPSRASASSDSQLLIRFTLDESRPFIFSTSLSAEISQLSLFEPTASAGADVFVTARLVGVSSGVIVDREVRDATANDGVVLDEFFLEGVLAPDTYTLEILALTDLRGTEDAAGFAVSGFGVSFAVIPEPGTATLIGLGLVLLAKRRTGSRS